MSAYVRFLVLENVDYCMPLREAGSEGQFMREFLNRANCCERGFPAHFHASCFMAITKQAMTI